MNLTLGSLFDGIGGFPLAAARHGIKTLWSSEIDKSCCEITARHFPDVEQLGDITKINGAEIPPVDIISFGSPCQDLSVAGKQAGLDGERSGLFLEAVRIIYEMRRATYGVYPAYVIWENVPGAFGSHGGEDFRRVLQELTKSEISMPKSGKWGGSGVVRTDRLELAWRTYDAQYWGVPQRRKRIYLVGDFRGRRAAEIQFEPESLLGYSPQSGSQRERASGTAGSGIASAGRDKTRCLTSWDCQSKRIFDPAGVYPTLQAMDCGGANNTAVLIPMPACLQGVFEMTHADEVIRRTEGNVCPTLTSRMGTGGNQVPLVVQAAGFLDLAPAGAHGIGYEEEMSPTLRAGVTPAVVAANQPAYSIAGNTIDRKIENGGNGKGVNEDVSFTLNTIDRHAVAYSFYPQRKDESQCFTENVSGCLVNGTSPGYQNGVVAPVCTKDSSQNKQGVIAFRQDAYDKYSRGKIAATLKAKGGSCGGGSENLAVYEDTQQIRWIVRRLMPIECERLQGFPDGWTQYKPDGTEIKDAPRFKALGNSIAIPCAERVFRGIIDAEEEAQ